MAAIAYHHTKSLCPECLGRIDALIYQVGDKVYMKKLCSEHGEFITLIWEGPPNYAGWDVNKTPWTPENPAPNSGRGCPFECGLCPEHRQQTCTALIEVTQRCNLKCKYCFAESSGANGRDLPVPRIEAIYSMIARSQPESNIQISGGEPTVRNDLPEIIKLGRSKGFDFIQLNTNGIRLADDPSYVKSLSAAGLSSVFLQFDGTEDAIHQQLRARPLLAEKLKAIDHCGQNNIGVVLVPTLVPGVNDGNLGELMDFAAQRSPVVRGVHFQPVSYFGRFPGESGKRITIPRILRELESQTQGKITKNQFGPPLCENPKCSFKGLFAVMPDNTLRSFTNSSVCCSGDKPKKAEEGAAGARRFVASKWVGPKNQAKCPPVQDIPLGEWDLVLERMRTHSFSITGMAFQDVWNVDMERLKDCCIHVAPDTERLIPFCAYNLTSRSGKSLYREQK